MLILIDNGANYNFISANLVVELGLVVQETSSHNVCLGDGHRKTTSGCCNNIIIQLENLEVKEKFYLSEIGGVDLIMGVTWLASLVEVKINWKILTMSFGHGEREVLIKGDPTLTKRVVSPEALLKDTKIKVVTLLWGLGKTKLEEMKNGKE